MRHFFKRASQLRSFSSSRPQSQILGSTVESVSSFLADTAAFSSKFDNYLSQSPVDGVKASLRSLYAQHFLFLEAVSNYCFFSNASVDNPALQDYRLMLERNQDKMDKLLPDYRVRPTLLRPILQFQGFDSGISAILYGRENNLKIKEGFERALLEQITEILRALYDLEGVDEAGFEKKPIIDFLKEMRDAVEERQTGRDEEGWVSRVSEESFRFLSKVAWRV